ncbi:MAG: Uma2 family endonuclease [Deltaproteobacteria bacterium]|nr:MAG: Uma2 family endonuclease [Deltaproteobacteria bacterium]
MARPATTHIRAEARYTTSRYFALPAEGILTAADRVELLEGLIVAIALESPRHAAGIRCASEALSGAVGPRAVVRVQLPLIAGQYSVPAPDLAVVPGLRSDYADTHPTTALLVIEIADTTLIQDRITKSVIYAAAGIPEYWVVNARDDHTEVFRAPDRSQRAYGEQFVANRGSRLELRALPGVGVAVDNLLP